MDIVESKKPIIILSYHNCEIYCCHLDGYKFNRLALINRLARIEASFLSEPANAKLRVWYNMDENNMDTSIMKLIAESIVKENKKIYKIAFIGLHGIAQWKFNYILKHTLNGNNIPKAYFTDAELAKGWLV